MSKGTFTSEQAPVVAVHQNLNQEIIQITEDKLRLVLNEHASNLGNRHAWNTPFGIVITLITVFVSAEFKNAMSLSADTWKAIFIISLLISVFWLTLSLVKTIGAPKVEDVIDKIKNKKSDIS